MNSKNHSDLYQKTILAHNKIPKNFGKMVGSCCSYHGQNRMCGDYITLHLKFDNDKDGQKKLVNITFEGEGCALLIASASMMTELLKGKKIQEINQLMIEFKVILHEEVCYNDNLGEANVFAGLSKYQSRVQCAMLSWETLIKGINNNV